MVPVTTLPGIIAGTHAIRGIDNQSIQSYSRGPMPTARHARPTAAAILLAGLSPLAATAWQPGTFPAAPQRMQSRGLAVDTQSRNDVVAFWHAVYQESEGYEKRISWTGNYSGNPGSVSRAFVDDVERRLNYFRAMCGVPANARVNSGSTVAILPDDSFKPSPMTKKSEASQAAALMLVRNYNSSNGTNPAIDHSPPSSLTGWSAAAWNASANGNLAFGLYGPGAITEYMMEEVVNGSATSVWNSLVGHRRWALDPRATDFATGDQPGQSAFLPPTNVLYITQNEDELAPGVTPDFVCYPPAGYFPAPVNSRFWSISHPDADFDNATVTVKDANGKSVPVLDIQSNSSYADPALIWEVGGDAATKSVYADRPFLVTINGIQGTSLPASVSYTVTLIHPDRLTFNQTLTGSPFVKARQSGSYSFIPAPAVEAVRIGAFRRKPATWKEGAESQPKPMIIDRTTSNYKLLSHISDPTHIGPLSGSKSFRLTFPYIYDPLVRGVPEQSFEIDRLILPKAGARLEFMFRRGFMSRASTLVAEVSSDGGVTWRGIGKAIKGVSDSIYDNAPSRASLVIPASSQPIRVRFRYFAVKGQPIYTHANAPSSPTGIYLDDISFKNCDWLEPRKSTIVAKADGTFTFNSTTAGAALVEGDRWCLAMGVKLGGRWFPHGPMKMVNVTR